MVTSILRDTKLVEPLGNSIMEQARKCFGEDIQSAEGICLINKDKLESKENIDKFTKLVNQDMQSFALIQENLSPNIRVEENKKLASAFVTGDK